MYKVRYANNVSDQKYLTSKILDVVGPDPTDPSKPEHGPPPPPKSLKN